MNILKLQDLFSILSPASGPCVSIYISAGTQGLWAPRTIIRYRKLLKHAEDLLLRTCTKESAELLLNELRIYSSLQPQASHAQTLCFFSSEKLKGFFPISRKVPDLSVVAESFHVTPIADFVNPFRTWFLVKLTKFGLSFYRGRGPALEFLQAFEQPNIQKALHQESSPLAIKDSSDNAAKNYSVDNCLSPKAQSDCILETPSTSRFSANEHELFDLFLDSQIPDDCKRFPLVLTGTKADTDSYAKSTSQNFDLTVNFSERYRELEAERLKEVVWPKLSEIYDQDRRIAIAGLREARQSGLTTTDPEQIVARLNSGKLKLLALTPGELNWGTIDWKNGAIETHPTLSEKEHLLDDCIYDGLLERAMVQGCKVYLCKTSELPPGARVLAV